MCSLHYKQIHRVILGSLSNDDSDAEDNMQSRMNCYFTSGICSCPDLFSTPVALKHAQAKYVLRLFNSKWKDEKLAAIVHNFLKLCRTWSFQVLVLQSSVKNCTNIYNAHTQHLFCSLNLDMTFLLLSSSLLA